MVILSAASQPRANLVWALLIASGLLCASAFSAGAHDAAVGRLGCHTDLENHNYHCHEGVLAGRVFPDRQSALRILAAELQARRVASSGRRNDRPAQSTLSVPTPPRSAGESSAIAPSLPAAVTPGMRVFQAVTPSVYVLLTYPSPLAYSQGKHSAQGSAVALSAAVAATNCHVLEHGELFALYKDRRRTPVTPLGADTAADRCTVRSEVPLTPVAGLRRYADVQVGEQVFSVGSPNGLENTLGAGLLSGKRVVERIELLQTSAPISPGSSGGGLFDSEGRLIGITTFLLRDSQNLNFAIPIDGYLGLAMGLSE